MKIGVVIGASKDAVHIIKKAKENGIYVVALDGNPNAEGFLYADKQIVVDISDLEKVCQKIDIIKPDFIMPVPIGRYLTTIGYINEKYHLKGIGYSATIYSTDKYLFHERLANSGLRNVKIYLVNKEMSLENLKISYPAIMKPRFGSGSRDVFYITNDIELEQAYKYAIKVNEDFVLEEVVNGEEYGVDGAVINGRLEITLLRKKMITPLPIRQAIANFSLTKITENTNLLEKVQSKLKKVIEKLEYENCIIHADLIIKENEIFIIEIAPRPSGHYLHNVFVPYATGIDIAEEYIKFLLDKKCCFLPKSVYCMQIRFFDFENVVIKKVPTFEELKRNKKCNILKWICNIKDGDYIEKVIDGHSIMGRGFFIIEGENEEDLIQQSEWILSQFECSKELYASNSYRCK